MEASVNTSLVRIDDPEADRGRIDEALRGIVDRLQGLADEQVRRKSLIEQRWIEDLRAYHGKYDPGVEKQLRDAKRSYAFVRMTRKKTNSWYARIIGLLFPTDDRNWGIQPTPVPRLTKFAKQAMQQAQKLIDQANESESQAQEMAQPAPAPPGMGDNGGPPLDDVPDPQMMAKSVDLANQAERHLTVAQMIEGEIAEAKKRAEAMQEVMDDQLVECHYAAEARDAIRDMVRLGTGIIKGPMVKGGGRGSWAQGDDGSYQLKRNEAPAPVVKRVDPWAYFPDMSATKPEEREFDFERHLWTASDLRSLAKDGGFSRAAVGRILKDGSSAPMTGPGVDYLVQLRSITGEGEGLTGRYVGWEYHGLLECGEVATMMRAMGDADGAAEYELADDPLLEKRVILFFCNGEILKIADEYPLDSGESLYSIANFEPGEASLFGYGVPNIGGDSQRAMNGAWRMAMDNGGASSKPQVVMDRSMVEPADGSYAVTPGKLWWKKVGPVGQGAPFEVYNIENNTDRLLNIFEVARRNFDDEVALPPAADGEMLEGPAQTATAQSIAAGGSNVIFRAVVKAWDDGITTPSMRRLYDWNMQFSDREDIKGDMSIDARGTSVLLVREIQSQVLMGITTNWLPNQSIAPMLKPYQMVRKTLQSMQIDPSDVMATEDDYEKALANMAKQAQNAPPDPATIQSQTRLEIAKITTASAEKVANMENETELVKLAETRGMSLEKLKTDIAKVQIQGDAADRRFAAEVAIEQQNATEARARGEQPKGSGGYISE